VRWSPVYARAGSTSHGLVNPVNVARRYPLSRAFSRFAGAAAAPRAVPTLIEKPFTVDGIQGRVRGLLGAGVRDA
jgi:hypothetical protein